MEEREGRMRGRRREGDNMSYGVLWVPVGLLSLNRLNVQFETVINDITERQFLCEI